jgi:hypothetical protein
MITSKGLEVVASDVRSPVRKEKACYQRQSISEEDRDFLATLNLKEDQRNVTSGNFLLGP